MPIPTYTPGYPPDGSSLGQTKSTIRDNLDGTFQTLGVDHINNNGQPGSKPAGYHNVIHVVAQGADPAPVASYGQLYSKTVNSFTTDQALFWETGAGIIQQLTTNILPTATSLTNGYTFLPGGIIIQWGQQTVTASSTTPLLFATGGKNVTFPNNCFNVSVTGLRSNSGGDGIFVLSGSVSATGFTFRNGSSSITQAFWIAIGN